MGTLQNEDDFEDSLKKLECPFTWDMDDIDGTVNTDYKPHDEEELIPLLRLMRTIMKLYVRTIENEDSEIILNELNNSNSELLPVIEQCENQYSIDAVRHVLKATHCHIYWKLDKGEEAKKIFSEVKNLKIEDKLDKSTIYACRSLAWSKYHALGSGEAVDFIRKALEDNPDCPIWNFILGKNLRRIRRDLSVGAIPNEDEAEAFLKSYTESKNDVYGIFLAQMYREKREDKKALQMYQEIFRNKPKSNTIYLRLALGFIKLNNLPLAKQCLDEVAVKLPENCMYLHYRGIYYMKTKKFREAIYYLKKAADMGNYPAARQYVRCIKNINRTFDTLEYLLDLIEKYKNLPEIQLQTLLLDTAFIYFSKNDYKNALKYFAHCLEIDPNSMSVKEFYSTFNPGKCQNIYNVLLKEVFPVVKEQLPTLDEKTAELYEELKMYYVDYLQSEINSTEKGLSKVRT